MSVVYRFYVCMCTVWCIHIYTCINAITASARARSAYSRRGSHLNDRYTHTHTIDYYIVRFAAGGHVSEFDNNACNIHAETESDMQLEWMTYKRQINGVSIEYVIQ